MKRILYISAFLPYDIPFAGSRTSYRILKNLSIANKIDLLSFYNEDEAQYVDEFLNFCDKEEQITSIGVLRVNYFTRILNSLSLFFMPAFLTSRFSLMHLFKIKNKYDFIYVDYSQSIFFGYILSKVLGNEIGFSVADIMIQSLERKYKEERNLIKKLFYGFEYLKASFLEKRLLDVGRLIIVQSKKDKNILIDMGIEDKKILGINPYFNQGMLFDDKCSNEKTFNILFWGAMNRIENIDAVVYYLSTFHESLKERIPHYKFIIAGVNPPETLINSYKDDNSVHVTGFIDDPSEIFNISHIAVVPLRLGAGIKVKTLEMLYMGLPTISTDTGAEGIYINEKNGLHIQNSEALFLEKILELYINYENIDKNIIHKNIKDTFNFDKSLEDINARIESVGIIE
jgi:polysaccharide biosynthesis protein PslH